MTDIKIDADSMQALVLKAILDSWDEETRDKLVVDALAELLKKSGRYNDPAPIESIIKNVLFRAAEQAVKQLFDEDEALQAKIRNMVSPILDTVLGEGENGLNIDERVAEALVAEIRKRRGY